MTQFSRSTRLFEAFPQSSAGPKLSPAEVQDSVNLTHPYAGPGSLAEEWATFDIVGGVGVSPVATSAVPTNRIAYYQTFVAFHNDPAARRILITLAELNVPRDVEIYDSASDPAFLAVGVPTNVVCIVRDFWVPPGFTLRAYAIGLGAAQTLSIKGVTAVYGLAEEPPPKF